MEKPLQQPPHFTENISVGGNLSRLFNSYWLSTGVLDERIKSFKIRAGSLVKEVTRFLEQNPEIKNEFETWTKQEPIIVFIGYVITLDEGMIGERIRLLTNYDRLRMPKNLKKSFLTKARNRLIKFNANLDDYNKNMKNSSHNQSHDLEGWLRYALETNEQIVDHIYGSWAVAGTCLSEIRNLYHKTMEFSEEPIDDIVKQLMDEVSVIEVQSV